MLKKAIAVYNPSDYLERAIQESYYKHKKQWLGSYQCSLAAKALSSLKIFDDWLDERSLFSQRIDYFFSNHFCKYKDVVVFLCHRLFLLDIFENGRINTSIFDPVVFVSTPIAYYLFREYPMHVYINYETLKDKNKNNFMEIGGLIIYDNNVKIDKDCIIKVNNYQQDNVVMNKAAYTEIDRGIFKSDEHERNLCPGMSVWDKQNRVQGKIIFVEPGENSLIGIEQNDGVVSIPKKTFDKKFSIV